MNHTRHLYQFFLAHSETEISYRKIKSLTERLNLLLGETRKPYEAAVDLLKIGLIEQTSLSKFRLSPSSMLRGAHFQLGINLPIEFSRLTQDNLIDQYNGLAIYPIFEINSDFPVQDFNLNLILAKFQSFHRTIKNLLQPNAEYPSFLMLERYDPVGKKFQPVKSFLEGMNLYKLYSFSGLHFDYFLDKSNESGHCSASLRFDRADIELLNIIKTFLGIRENKAGIVYQVKSESLVIEPYHPFPGIIEKLLFFNSTLRQGKFVAEREYALTKPEAGTLNQILNYKLIMNHE